MHTLYDDLFFKYRQAVFSVRYSFNLCKLAQFHCLW